MRRAWLRFGLDTDRGRSRSRRASGRPAWVGCQRSWDRLSLRSERAAMPRARHPRAPASRVARRWTVSGGEVRSHRKCWTGTEYRHVCRKPSGRMCVDCRRPAGTDWGPMWCPDCDVKRLDRVGAQMESLLAPHRPRGFLVSGGERRAVIVPDRGAATTRRLPRERRGGRPGAAAGGSHALQIAEHDGCVLGGYIPSAPDEVRAHPPRTRPPGRRVSVRRGRPGDAGGRARGARVTGPAHVGGASDACASTCDG